MYNKMLHTYSDGSILKVIPSRELISIPIWKGQRILDKEHASSIKSAIGENIRSLDSGFSIIKYKEEATDGKIIELFRGEEIIKVICHELIHFYKLDCRNIDNHQDKILYDFKIVQNDIPLSIAHFFKS